MRVVRRLLYRHREGNRRGWAAGRRANQSPDGGDGHDGQRGRRRRTAVRGMAATNGGGAAMNGSTPTTAGNSVWTRWRWRLAGDAVDGERQPQGKWAGKEWPR